MLVSFNKGLQKKPLPHLNYLIKQALNPLQNGRHSLCIITFLLYAHHKKSEQ